MHFDVNFQEGIYQLIFTVVIKPYPLPLRHADVMNLIIDAVAHQRVVKFVQNCWTSVQLHFEYFFPNVSWFEKNTIKENLLTVKIGDLAGRGKRL